MLDTNSLSALPLSKFFSKRYVLTAMALLLLAAIVLGIDFNVDDSAPYRHGGTPTATREHNQLEPINSLPNLPAATPVDAPAAETVLLQFHDGVTPAAQATVVARINATIAHRFRRASMVRLNLPAGVDAEWATEFFSQQPEVEISEPDIYLQLNRLPDDPLLSDYWGLHNSTSYDSLDPDIDAAEAWDITTGSRDVAVMVVDSGTSIRHPDLAANIWTNPGEIPDNQIDDDGNGYIDDVHGTDPIFKQGSVLDFNGHGTHVAGTIAAVGNNGEGGTGVMWQGAIITCQVFDQEGSGSLSSILECYDYAAALKETGVTLVAINNSFGTKHYSRLLDKAVGDIGDLDILYVASAGNSALNTDDTPHYPSGFDFPHVISVAAIDQTGDLSYFSNYGTQSVDIAAPGSEIASTWLDDRYAYLSGTSMAAPHIVGLAGLIASLDPTLSALQIKDLILSGATRDPRLADKLASGGRAHIALPIVDQDGDGVPDTWEQRFGFDPGDPSDGTADPDNDGLTNREEFRQRTDPNRADTDGDGLTDGAEVSQHGTSPLRDDTDNDGRTDKQEVDSQLSDPLLADTDQDGLTDDEEFDAGSDPTRSDTDGDGLSDHWEVVHGQNPADPLDERSDLDGDGLSAAQEHDLGLHPGKADTDQDGLNDGAEVNLHRTDPLLADTDGGGAHDGWEVEFGLNPLDAADEPLDSDGDGATNRGEFLAGSNPLDAGSVYTLNNWHFRSGNSKRQAWAPLETKGASFAERWRRSDWGQDAIVADQLMIVHSNFSPDGAQAFLKATSLIDQSEAWKVDVPGGIFEKLVLGDTIVAIRGGVDLVAFDVSSGTILWERSVQQVQPTTYWGTRLSGVDDQIYVRIDDQLVSIDLGTGEDRWSTSIPGISGSPQPNRFTDPTFSTDWVAVYASDTLSLLRRSDGSTIRSASISYCTERLLNQSSVDEKLITDFQGNLLLSASECLYRISPSTLTVLWSHAIEKSFYLYPAVDRQYVYIPTHRENEGGISARSLDSGEEVWFVGFGDFITPAAFDYLRDKTHHLAVTLDHVIAQTSGGTYAIRLTTQKIEAIHPSVGDLVITGDETLYLHPTGQLLALELQTNPDLDDDGLPNYWELQHGLAADDPNDSQLDADGDGLTNSREFSERLNPTLADTDADGVSDGDELTIYATNPREADTDRDGLSDGVELSTGTNPFRTDSDGDSFSDADETEYHGTDPLKHSSRPESITRATQDFESGQAPGWSLDSTSTGSWRVAPEGARNGRFGLVATNSASHKTLQAVWQANFAAGELQFDARLAPGVCCDRLEVKVDDNYKVVVRESVWRRFNLSIPAGTTRIEFSFRSDGRRHTNDELAAIDNILIRPSRTVSSDSGDVLSIVDTQLHRLDRSGKPTAAPYPIRSGSFNSNDFAVTGENRLVIATRDEVVFFNPMSRTEEVSLATNGYNPSLTANTSFVFAAALNRAEGITRIRNDGSIVDTTHARKRFFDLTIGADGLLYGLRDEDGAIEVINPDTMEPLRTVDADCSLCAGVAADSNGNIYVIDRRGRVSALAPEGTVTNAFATNHPYPISFFIDGDNRLYYSTFGGKVGSLNTSLEDWWQFHPGGEYSRLISPELAATRLPKIDSDGDGMPDWWEKWHKLKSLSPDALADADADGLTNIAEYNAGTNPQSPDTDDDGLTDIDELTLHNSNPLLEDTDGDLVSDGIELSAGSNLRNADSDNDGLSDADELAFGSSPTGVDSDNDGLGDGWEVHNGLDPTSPDDASLDPDSDGLSNLREQLAGTNRLQADTDLDGLTDGDEVLRTLTDPHKPDTDGDEMDDAWEVAHQLEPRLKDGQQDHDSDGFTSVQEFYAATHPRDAASIPGLPAWGMYQGDARHRGSIPLATDPAAFRLRWTQKLDGVAFNQGLSQPVSSNGTLYLSYRTEQTGHVAAYDLTTGDLTWRKDFPDRPRINAVAVHKGRVFVTFDNPAVLVALGASDGKQLYESPHSNFFSIRLAPTVHNTAVYLPGETNDGLTSFDSEDGSEQWSRRLGDFVVWGVAAEQGALYALSDEYEGNLLALDPLTGTPAWNAIDPNPHEQFGTLRYWMPVLGGRRNLIVRDAQRIVGYDLRTKQFLWQRPGDYAGQASWSNGKVYIVESGDITQLDAHTGEELWRWSPALSIAYPLVVSNSHVLFATDSYTAALELDSLEEVWRYPVGGHLAISDLGQLTIAGIDGDLVVLDLESEIIGKALAAAILPASRSVRVNQPATVFATMINAGTETARGCSITPTSRVNLLSSFQQTNPTTNLPIGTPNTSVDIPSGSYKTFLLSLMPQTTIAPTDIRFQFDCENSGSAPGISGINTLLLSADRDLVPDVVALAQTPSGDGIVELRDSVGAFSVATINLGAASTVRAIAEPGEESPPVSLALCATNAISGDCESSVIGGSEGVEMTMVDGDTSTFAIFVGSTDTSNWDPAKHRVSVRFVDSEGVVRGATSVAYRAGQPSQEPFN